MKSTPNHNARPRLSVSMIVRNEEKYLAGCLDSVKDIADEIVIVDTGSTDATIGIAEQYGARIIHFPWMNDFAEARNESLRHCAGDWVLSIDADERLSPESRNELLRVINDRNAMAFDCLLSCIENQPKGPVHNIAPYPRLFRRLPSLRYEGKVHEQIGPSIVRSGFSILPSSIIIDHLGYAQSTEIYAEKCGRNAQLLRNQLAEHPEDVYSRFQLGNTLAMLSRHEEAIAELKQTLKMPTISPRIQALALNALASVYADEKQNESALKYARASLEVVPSQVTARWIAVRALISSQDFAAALPVLIEVEDALNNNTSQGMVLGFDARVSIEEVCFWKGVCSQRVGDIDGAARAFYEGLSRTTTYPGMLDLYLECVRDVKDASAFVSQLGDLMDRVDESAALMNAVAQLSLRQHCAEKAKIALDRCTGNGFENDDTRGLWIQYYLFVSDKAAALKVYESSIKAGADSHLFHKSALQLMLATNDFARAMTHVEGMSRGLSTMPLSGKPATALKSVSESA